VVRIETTSFEAIWAEPLGLGLPFLMVLHFLIFGWPLPPVGGADNSSSQLTVPRCLSGILDGCDPR
jgi:hypothetical protein